MSEIVDFHTIFKGYHLWFFCEFWEKSVIFEKFLKGIPFSLLEHHFGQKLKFFKQFIEKVVKKKDAKPFRIPKNINLVMVDVGTGLPADSNSKKIIYEAFKSESVFFTNLEKLSDKNRLGLYDSKRKKSVLKFY